VKDGDTVDSIAGHFKVDPTVILTFNRCYFEPERCAAGQKIFVRGAELPALLEPDRPARDVFAAAPQVAQQPRNGRLSWPVGGVITQLFWWGHTGVDVAAKCFIYRFEIRLFKNPRASRHVSRVINFS